MVLFRMGKSFYLQFYSMICGIGIKSENIKLFLKVRWSMLGYFLNSNWWVLWLSLHFLLYLWHLSKLAKNGTRWGLVLSSIRMKSLPIAAACDGHFDQTSNRDVSQKSEFSHGTLECQCIHLSKHWFHNLVTVSFINVRSFVPGAFFPTDQ